MANEKIIAQDVFEQSIKDILQLIANNTYNWQEYTDTEISDILEISDEQAIELSKIINDNVKSNIKLWSSNKVDTEIQNAIIEANKYADELIGQISSISLEYVTSLPTTDIKSNVIYILQGTPNTLNVYNTSTSAFVTVGDLDLDLSQYYTKTEIDTLLADKADKDSVVTSDDIITDTTQATGANVLAASTTITELDKKFDKTSILTSNSNTATDEQVYSASIMNTELDKKANDDEVVKKTSMSTIINNTSTDDSIPTSKTLYNLLGIKNFTEEEINSYGNQTMETGMVSNTIAKTVITDTINDWYYLIKLPWDSKYNSQIWISASGEQRAFIRYTKSVGVWDTPKLICTTKVADVPSTSITNKLVSSKVSLTNSDSYVAYCVKNGTCQVTIWSMQINAACSGEKLFEGLPKSLIGATTNLCNGLESFGQVFIAPGSTTISLNANASVVGKNGYCSFSYQVAE